MRLKKGLILGAAFMVLSPLMVVFNVHQANAAQITARSLTLVATGTDGGSKPSGVVGHQFNFSIPSGTSIGSIKFEYCTTASVATCVMPTGLSTTSATLGTVSGWATGTTLTATTNGSPYISKTAASGSGAVSVRLNAVTNPSAVNTTFFVRITSYVATNATGSAIDTGSVAASTAEPIVLTGTMPESLIFCTGATVTVNCASATAGAVTFNQLFSPTDTATATSQMAASTNAAAGYAITVNGATLTSGGNTIPAMGTSAAGVRGTGQFGMNLKLNTVTTSTVAVGAEVAPAADGVNLKGQSHVVNGYGTVDFFKFVTGQVVAESTNGGAGPTNSQVYTTSYIVNVAGNQASGTYTTTLTYICTATY